MVDDIVVLVAVPVVVEMVVDDTVVELVTVPVVVDNVVLVKVDVDDDAVCVEACVVIGAAVGVVRLCHASQKSLSSSAPFEQSAGS